MTQLTWYLTSCSSVSGGADTDRPIPPDGAAPAVLTHDPGTQGQVLWRWRKSCGQSLITSIYYPILSLSLSGCLFFPFFLFAVCLSLSLVCSSQCVCITTLSLSLSFVLLPLWSSPLGSSLFSVYIVSLIPSVSLSSSDVLLSKRFSNNLLASLLFPKCVSYFRPSYVISHKALKISGDEVRFSRWLQSATEDRLT